MSAGVALSARGVTHRYRRGAALALYDVTLEVPRGSTVALIGPNGAGKSTLLRSWLGFERPSEGQLLVEGVDVRRDAGRAIGSIGYVSQTTTLYAGLSLRQHIDLASTLRRGFDEARAMGRLTDLGLDADRPTSELSAGQQAQVALTIALGADSSVLLLDEPLASLDVLSRHEFTAAVREQTAARGVTSVISSHIVGDLDAFCDRIVVLGAGVLLLDAWIDEVIAQHGVLPAPALHGRDAIGAFPRAGGSMTALVRDDDGSLERPTLEDLVKGYLATARLRASRQ